VATQLVLHSFSEGGRVTTENAPFADRNKNFLPFLKTFEIASLYIFYSNSRSLMRFFSVIIFSLNRIPFTGD